MNLSVRSATLEDAPAIDALLSACSAAYLGNSRGGGEARERLSEPGSEPAVVLAPIHDGARRSRRGDTTVVGFGHVWPAGDEARCFARVHPDATGRGVGTALLDDLERRARGLGPARLNVTQWATDTRAPELLTARGYTPTQYILRMTVELAGYQPQDAPLPPGLELTGFDPERDRAGLYAAWRAAFPDEPSDEERWWHERAVDPTAHFDPALWLLARQGSEIVGCCLGLLRDDRRHATVGYVGDVAVRPERRGQGVALALLTRMLGRFADAGLPAATLDVDADNLTGALRLYRKAGMHSVPMSTIWSKAL